MADESDGSDESDQSGAPAASGASGAVALLLRLIEVDTVNPDGDELAAARLLAGELAPLAPDELQVVEVPRPRGRAGAYLWARWGRPRLLVNAHLDTVPPAPGWSAPPHRPRVADGRVYGLGASDDKGAVAAVVRALAAARPRDLGVLFSGDEEHHGNCCVRAFLASGAAAGIERAIVCEPTGLRVGTRHRGIVAMAARASGPGGHSSQADRLPAPLAELARVAAALDDWGRARREQGPPGFPGLCVNLARLDGGVAFNVVPTRTELTFSLRPPPGADVGALREEIAALVRAASSRTELECTTANPPFATRAADAFRPCLGAAVDAPVDLPYWTEAALWSEAGIDCVVFGPGHVAQAHAPDEHVAVAELEAAVATFTQAFDARG